MAIYRHRLCLSYTYSRDSIALIVVLDALLLIQYTGAGFHLCTKRMICQSQYRANHVENKSKKAKLKIMPLG